MVKKKKHAVRSSKKATNASAKGMGALSLKPRSKINWFSWLKVSSFVVAFGIIAGILTLDSAVMKDLQASLLAQFANVAQAPNSSSNVSEVSGDSSGILLAYDLKGENEKKLLDIFGTVFPDSAVKTVSYQSAEGKALAQQLEVGELPALFFKKNAFDQEKLSEVVKDLFTLQGDYYSLNVSLVNPFGQARIKGPLNVEGGIWVGDQTAPITVYVYSDVKCQHCRAQERNNQKEFKKLIDEGIIRMVYLDLPQNADSMLHSIALQCLYQQEQNVEAYLSFRERLYGRPNLSKAFTLRELSNVGIDYDAQCHADVLQTMFKNRLKVADADGVTGVPALYIGKTDGQEFIRFSGDRKFTEYRAVFDRLLGQG